MDKKDLYIKERGGSLFILKSYCERRGYSSKVLRTNHLISQLDCKIMVSSTFELPSSFAI